MRWPGRRRMSSSERGEFALNQRILVAIPGSGRMNHGSRSWPREMASFLPKPPRSSFRQNPNWGRSEGGAMWCVGPLALTLFKKGQVGMGASFRGSRRGNPETKNATFEGKSPTPKLLSFKGPSSWIPGSPFGSPGKTVFGSGVPLPKSAPMGAGPAVGGKQKFRGGA